ncbi:hypothetical protein EDB81DRAFT_941300 [Dactylonectria macrodidyma]|uniref:Glycosyl transferase CAP10 domain-containing protein n=1 Tax=Dactylonectria macrodidyma TaxID=307937 RepID=A0A9P9FQ84_9HYPO|nr:hypothetical protein EDB81DRAFT_941300 [Dactylonectria macrodidyma]
MVVGLSGRRRLVTLAIIISFCFCAYTLFGINTPKSVSQVKAPEGDIAPERLPSSVSKPIPVPTGAPVWEDVKVIAGGPVPKDAPGTAEHPIAYLIRDAESEAEKMTTRQSASLKDAVAEYRRRYQMPPPPHFDKWFNFAKANHVKLVDEFDTIHELMTPFWGLKPKTIRARAKEALGFDNGLIGIAIRNHQITRVQGGEEWQKESTKGMIAKFIEFLPDMDLAFNLHDEPRVVVSHEDLANLRRKAKDENIPAAFAVKSPTNRFTETHAELNDGKSFEETTLTRFNTYSHQPIWSDSRVSCPPDTPARNLEEEERTDDRSKYGMSELGFVYNMTALSDICLTPSLSSTFGFFDGPNTYKVVHDLFPIFSQSKISSYNDLIYPSPWYWSDRVPFDQARDIEWEKKQNQLYWRGSTTGGYSRNGRWRRQHRQRLVQAMNARDQTKIMINKGTAEQPEWGASEAPRGDYRDLVDVHFSHVGQCDPGDCEAQTAFFKVAEHEEQQDAWNYKYLLDMDGNAFSGRFYAFLRSRSLVFKHAVFREWHAEWLKPWAHYVPLSIQGDDWLETIRFFNDGANAAETKRLAEASRFWAENTVRPVDMEAWFFRLLLEYARVIDDNRETIGFDLTNGDKAMPGF